MLLSGGARLPATTVQAVNFIGHALAQSVPSAGSAAGAAYTVGALRLRGVDTGLALWSTTLAALFSAAVLVVLGPLALAFDHLISLPLALGLSVGAGALAWGIWSILRPPKTLHWIADRTVAVARHLPVVRTANWVARQSTAADAISERIAQLRPRRTDWAWFLGVTVSTWGFDYAALAASVAATSSPVPWPAVAIGYLAVQASIALELTPAGAGPAETGLLAALAAGGLPAASAGLAVVIYRLFTWVGLAAVGWLVFLVTARQRTQE